MLDTEMLASSLMLSVVLCFGTLCARQSQGTSVLSTWLLLLKSPRRSELQRVSSVLDGPRAPGPKLASSRPGIEILVTRLTLVFAITRAVPNEVQWTADPRDSSSGSILILIVTKIQQQDHAVLEACIFWFLVNPFLAFLGFCLLQAGRQGCLRDGSRPGVCVTWGRLKTMVAPVPIANWII